MDSDEHNGPARNDKGHFLPGHGMGRPKGSRNKLGEQFLSDLQKLWEQEGADVLKEARQEKPMEFAKMVAGLLPKELLVRTAPEQEMTDDELAETIDRLRAIADAFEGSALQAGSGTEAAERLQ
jgi:hypothetical protein